MIEHISIFYIYFDIYTNFQNIKLINTLKTLRETMYVGQPWLTYKMHISTVFLSSVVLLRFHRSHGVISGLFMLTGVKKHSVQPL